MSGILQPGLRRMAATLAVIAALAGCRASVPPPGPADHAPPPATQVPIDGSYDWHVLLVAPFGSVLKDVALPLHEVLLFRDQAGGGSTADDAECFASDAPAPRFVGRTPDEFLLCFKQDRLARIQASVRLTTAEAPAVFAAACTGWLQHAVRTASDAEASASAAPRVAAAGALNTEAQTSSEQGALTCEGRDGAIHFGARLGEEPGPADAGAAPPPPAQTPPTDTPLSIVLDSAPNP
jgi:hypothetical protein